MAAPVQSLQRPVLGRHTCLKQHTRRTGGIPTQVRNLMASRQQSAEAIGPRDAGTQEEDADSSDERPHKLFSCKAVWMRPGGLALGFHDAHPQKHLHFRSSHCRASCTASMQHLHKTCQPYTRTHTPDCRRRTASANPPPTWSCTNKGTQCVTVCVRSKIARYANACVLPRAHLLLEKHHTPSFMAAMSAFAPMAVHHKHPTACIQKRSERTMNTAHCKRNRCPHQR